MIGFSRPAPRLAWTPGTRKALIALLVAELRAVDDLAEYADRFGAALDALNEPERGKLKHFLAALSNRLSH